MKPDAGYELDELTVTDAKNKDLKVTKRSETTYTFHMADSKVTVEGANAFSPDAPCTRGQIVTFLYHAQ